LPFNTLLVPSSGNNHHHHHSSPCSSFKWGNEKIGGNDVDSIPRNVMLITKNKDNVDNEINSILQWFSVNGDRMTNGRGLNVIVEETLKRKMSSSPFDSMIHTIPSHLLSDHIDFVISIGGNIDFSYFQATELS
jgi:hypothetical protein